MAIYEYETKLGTVRAFYQTITTNSGQGYFEQFMGVEGTLVISEASGRGTVYREAWVEEPKWEPWTKLGYITAIEKEEPKPTEDTGVVLDVRESPTPPAYDIPVSMEGKAYHPGRLMQPEDVASVVVNALALPRTAEVTDIHIRPLKKP